MEAGTAGLRRRARAQAYMTSREELTMEHDSITFSKGSGCFVTRCCAVLLLLLFAAALIATAVLAHVYSSRRQCLAVDDDGADDIGVDTVRDAKAAKARDVRLPLHLMPEAYRVRLLPFLEEGNFTFSGEVTMTLRAQAAATNVTVHVKDMAVRHSSVAVRDVTESRALSVTGHKHDDEREFYVVSLAEPLAVGHRYEVFIAFVGNLNDKLVGFYRSSYKAPDGRKRWLAVTQFQPTDARRAFPCLDEPALKATFEITLGRAEGMTSVSNMPVRVTEPNKRLPGFVWDVYKKSVPMSTYLVAFVVSDLAVREADVGLSDTLFRVWARPAAIDQGDYARNIGPRVLEYYEDFFHTEFPLPKQDMLALPDFAAGAMENWGIITYRETALLFDPKVSSSQNKQRVAEVVAHELAHQWFGNLVTPSWWTDLWLNEGFATYMQYLGADQVEPTWRMMDQFVTRVQQLVMSTDALQSSHPISIVVGHPDEISGIFDHISYLKGASLIRMMNHMLTPSTLRAGLTNYLKDKRYQAADQDDLWDFLTSQARRDNRLRTGVTIKDVMDTWTLQAGFPVVDVRRDYKRQQAVLTQSRFLLSGVNSSDTTLWWIPLVHTSHKAANFETTQPTFWMEKERRKTIIDMPPPEEWLIFNVRSVGYYKVNYDRRNWKMLIAQLQKDHVVIHSTNRAQLIDDALDLARAGQLDYETALSVIGYLHREEDFLPWTAAFNNLDFLDLQLKRSPDYGEFKRFVLKLIGPLYARLGFAGRPADSHLDHLTRVHLLHWACSMGHSECVRSATDLFRRWMASPDDQSIIPVDVRPVVYCTALTEGGEHEWNFVWARYRAANVASQKKTLMVALGCTKQIWLLNRYLKFLITPGSGVRVQDGAIVFDAVADSTVGRFLAWDFLRNSWSAIVETYGSGIFIMQRFIGSLKYGYNTPLDVEQLKQFYKREKKSLGDAKRELEQAIEVSTINVAWMDKNYDTIIGWLKKQ